MVSGCLESILKNKGDNWEVLVLDQSTNQETRKVVAGFRSKKIRYVSLNNRGKSKALNRGIEMSRGEVLAFTDDDVVVSKNWLKEIEGKFEDKITDLVLGKTLPYRLTYREGLVCPSITPAKCNHRLSVTMDHLFDANFLGDGNNMAIRRVCFESNGNFIEWLGVGTYAGAGEDWEFVYRMVKKRKKVMFDPKMVAYHNRWLIGLRQMLLTARYARGTSSFLVYLTLVTRDKRFGENWRYLIRNNFMSFWEARNYLGLFNWLWVMFNLTVNWLLGLGLGMIMYGLNFF